MEYLDIKQVELSFKDTTDAGTHEVRVLVHTPKCLGCEASTLNKFQENQLKTSKQLFVHHGERTDLVVFVENFEFSELKSTARTVLSSLKTQNIQEIDLVFSQELTDCHKTHFLKEILSSNYTFKVPEDQKTLLLTKICVLGLANDAILRDAREIYFTIFSRTLLNTRANVATPEFFVNLCKQFQAKHAEKVELQVLFDKELEQKGFGLMYAVGKGSVHKPAAINLTYRGDKENPTKMFALVGKGITFDSGGYNLKTGDFTNMYADKGGACAQLGAFRAAVELGLKINLTYTGAFAENLVDSTSYRPSDILISLKGLSVEIKNTDAEGRLVLADCMTWTQQLHKPQVLIELSTLTGGCVIALGHETAGIFSNSDELTEQLFTASRNTGEAIWRLPITQEYRNDIKGLNSDLKNIGSNIYGGTGKAAAFLEKFVEEGVKWAHVDIAGPALKVEAYGFNAFGVQLVLNYLKSQQSV